MLTYVSLVQSIVGTNIWVAHRNSDIFGGDASVFRPERWDPAITPEDKLREMEHYWLPFGAGTRTCIGKNISILEIAKLVPQLLRRYDFELLQKEVKYTNMWFVKQKDVRVRVKRAMIFDLNRTL